MFSATLDELSKLIPGLRLWRNRLRHKLEQADPGTPYYFMVEQEFEECVALLTGLLSICGDSAPDTQVGQEQ